jgi:hypothetical protein
MADDNTIKDILNRSFKYASNGLEDIAKGLTSSTEVIKDYNKVTEEQKENLSSNSNLLEELFEKVPELSKEYEKEIEAHKEQIKQINESIAQGKVSQTAAQRAIGLQNILLKNIKKEIDQRKSSLDEKIKSAQRASLGTLDISADMVKINASSASLSSGSLDGGSSDAATATMSAPDAVSGVGSLHPTNAAKEAGGVIADGLKESIDKLNDTYQNQIDKSTKEAVDNKSKDDLEKFYNSARAKITDITSMLTAGASFSQVLFKGSANDAIVFGKEMRNIAYEVEGIGSSTRGLQKEFANLGKNVSQQTGVPLEVMQDAYMKNIKKGMLQQNKSTKSQKDGLKVIKSGLHLSTMIGSNAENTSDLFGDWHRTLKLSSGQMSQLARDSKQIARSTGVTGDHLIESMKASEGILKNLENQGNLTNSAMKNVIKAMTEAKKLGVEDSFGKIGDALSSTNKLFFEADDKTKAFLFQMAGRMGEFDSMSAGTFMKSRSNMKKMGEGMESMMIEMAQGLGADVKNFEDLNKLTDTQRRDLAVALKARTGMEIGEFEKVASSFQKGGESLGDTLNGLDKVLKSSVSTTEERKKAQQDMDKALMQGGLSMLNSVSEKIEKTGGDVSSALKDLDTETKKNLDQDIAGIAERMGKDISKLSDEQKLQFAGLASAEKLQKAAGEKGVEVEDFSSQLKSAMSKGDSAGFRDVVARMNEASEKVDIRDKSSIDPVKDLGQKLKEMNESVRGPMSEGIQALVDSIGSMGLLFAAISAELAALTFAIGGTKFDKFMPGNMGDVKKSIGSAFSNFTKTFKETRRGGTTFGGEGSAMSIKMFRDLRKEGYSLKDAFDKVKAAGGEFYGVRGTVFDSFTKASDAFIETITGKAGMVSGPVSKISSVIAPFGTILQKALGPAVLLLGGIKGAMESASVGRTKTEGAILGALTGGAKTGSFLSPTLGVEKGSVADKTLGVGGAAAWGAMAGAAVTASLGGTDFGASIVFGAIIGALAEVVKIITEGTDILQNIFRPAQVVVDYIYYIFQDIYDVLAGIVTLDVGRVFKGIFNAIGSTLALIFRLPLSILEAAFIGIPKLILRSIGMIWEIPRMLMQSILNGLASLAENSWVGPIFKTLHDAFKELFDGFMAIWTPISEIFSGLYTVFNDLGKALFGAGEGAGLFSGIMWALQKAVWGVAYVISWLLSPIILLAKALGFVLKIVGALIKGIIAPFQWLYETLVGHSIVPDLVVAIVSWFAKLPILIFKSLLAIPKMIGNALSGIGSYLEGFSDIPIIGPMIAQIGNLIGFIGESINLLSEGIGHIFDIVQGIFTLDALKIWEGIKGIGSVIMGSLSNVGSFLYDSIVNSLGGLGSFLLGSLKTAFIDLPTYIFDGFKSALQGIWDWIASWIPGMKTAESAASGYKENAAAQAATMAEKGSSTAHAIGGMAGAGADLLQLDVGEAASKAGLALKEGVYAAGENLKTAADSAWGGVKAVGSYLNPFNYFQEGTRKIEEPGLAMLHQGEMVIPADLTKKISAEGSGPFGTIKPESQSVGSVGGTFIGSAAGSFVGSSMASPAVTIDIDESLLVKAVKDSFKFTKKLAGNIKKYAGSAFSGMGDYFSTAFAPMTSGFNRSMEAGQGIFTAMSRGIRGQYMSITKGKSISEIAMSAFSNIQNLVPESIKNYAASAFGAIQNYAASAFGAIQNLIPESFRNYASSTFSNISNGFSSMFSPMIKGFNRSMEAGEGIFAAMSRGIKGQYMSMTKGKSISEIASSSFEAIKTAPQSIKNYASSAFGKIQNLVPESVKNYASSSFGKIQNLVPESVKNHASSAFSKMSSGISSAFTPLTTEFTKSMTAGEGIFKSLSKGIGSQYSSVKEGLFKEGGIVDNQKKNLQEYYKAGKDKLLGRKADFAKGDMGQKGLLQIGKEKTTLIKDKVFGKIDPITGEKSKGLIDQAKDKAGTFYQAAKDKVFGKLDSTTGEKSKGLINKTKDKAGALLESTKEKLGFGKKEASSIEAIGSAGGKIGLMEKARDGLKNLAEGIKSFANKDVLLGALNLIPTGVGLVAMIPGFVGAKLIEKLSGEKIGESLSGLANGLSQMASGKVLLGAGALVLASLALLAMLPALPTLAILGAMSALITSGLTALSVGLSTFGAAAANPLLWLGILAIGALGLAMIPFGYALSTLSPLVVAFGSAINAAFLGIGSIISSIAAGMTMFLGAVSLEKAAGLVAVAGGLAVLSAAMVAFSAATAVAGWVSFFGGDGVVNKIMELAAAGPNLKMFADSIVSMSAGIKEFANQLSGLGDMDKNVDDFIAISKKLSAATSDVALPESIKSPTQEMNAVSTLSIPAIDRSPVVPITNLDSAVAASSTSPTATREPFGNQTSEVATLTRASIDRQATMSADPKFQRATRVFGKGKAIEIYNTRESLEKQSKQGEGISEGKLTEAVQKTQNSNKEPVELAINNISIPQDSESLGLVDSAAASSNNSIQKIDCCREASKSIVKASMMPNLNGLISSLSSGLKSAFVDIPMWLGGMLASGLKSAFVDIPMWLGGMLVSGLKSAFVDIPMWLGGMLVSGLKSIFVDLPIWLGGILVSGLKSVLVDLPMWLGGMLVSGLKSIFVDLPMWLGGMLVSGLKSIFVDLPMWLGGLVISGIKKIFIDLPMWLGGLVIGGIKKIFIDLPMWLGGLVIGGIKKIFIDLPMWLGSTIIGGITSLMGAIPGAIYNALYWAASKVGLGWVVKSLGGGGGDVKKPEGSEEKQKQGLLSTAWGGVKSAGSSVANAASGAWEGVKGFFGFGKGKEEVSLESILPLMAEFYKAGVSGSGILIRQVEKNVSDEVKPTEISSSTTSLFNDKNGRPDPNGIMWIDPMQLVNRNASIEPSAAAVNNATSVSVTPDVGLKQSQFVETQATKSEPAQSLISAVKSSPVIQQKINPEPAQSAKLNQVPQVVTEKDFALNLLKESSMKLKKLEETDLVGDEYDLELEKFGVMIREAVMKKFIPAPRDEFNEGIPINEKDANAAGFFDDELLDFYNRELAPLNQINPPATVALNNVAPLNQINPPATVALNNVAPLNQINPPATVALNNVAPLNQINPPATVALNNVAPLNQINPPATVALNNVAPLNQINPPATVALNNVAPLNQINPPATVALNNVAPLNQINPPATVALNNAAPLNQINPPATVASNNVAPLNQINPPATVASNNAAPLNQINPPATVASNNAAPLNQINSSNGSLAFAGSAIGLGTQMAQQSRFNLMDVGSDLSALGDENLISLLKKPFSSGVGATTTSAGSGLLGRGAEFAKNIGSKITSNPLASKVSGAFGSVASNPLVSKTLGRALPFLGLATGGISGAMQAKETGRSTTEAGLLGAITGDAKTGSTMSKYLGVEEGSTADKALGVGGAAATGAMSGAAIGTFFGGPIGTAIGAGVGGLLGGGAELYKWATEKKVPQPPKTDLEKLNNLNTSIDGSLSGSQDLLNKHAIPMANPTDVEARPITNTTTDVQPVHLRDIGQTILREKTSANSGTGKLQSDELTRMEETAYKQVEELEQIKEGINELVALMRPRGSSSVAGASNQIAGSTKDPRRPMQSAVFGKMKFGYPSGTANKDVLRTGE